MLTGGMHNELNLIDHHVLLCWLAECTMIWIWLTTMWYCVDWISLTTMWFYVDCGMNDDLNLTDHHVMLCWLAECQPTVHAGCFSVSIIHWTLTWTTGSLTCTQMLLHAIAHRVVWTHITEPALKVDSGRKIPFHTRGIEPVSVAWWSDALTNWATSPLFWVFM